MNANTLISFTRNVKSGTMGISFKFVGAKQRPLISDNAPSLNHLNCEKVHSNIKVTTPNRKQTEDNATKGGFNTSKLTLKVNKPFKKPKRILSTNVVNESNRPSIRSQRFRK
ncbi:CBM_collapsed_G0003450.mRNA.1.CDS.1 [Saccharomyces cerevisiae]|nr:CBM_collapsed_G0003450.mRNA.1.CDS.1 [Saccharomyces cerevisiae]